MQGTEWAEICSRVAAFVDTLNLAEITKRLESAGSVQRCNMQRCNMQRCNIQWCNIQRCNIQRQCSYAPENMQRCKM